MINKIIISIALFCAAGVLSFAQSTFSGERLGSAADGYVRSLVGPDAEVIVSSNVRDVEFTQSGVEARILGSAENFRGTCSVPIEFRANGKLLRRIDIPAQIIIYGYAPVATGYLRKGEIITEADFDIKKIDVTKYAPGQIPLANEIIGKELSCNLSEDAVIAGYALALDKIVGRGDDVTITVVSGGVRVYAKGSALQDGYVGEQIRVKSDLNGALLTGRVEETGEIVVKTK